MKENTKRARALRKSLTPQERKLWQIFRNHNFYGFEIRRQYPIEHYIVDFVCRSKKIVIEIDGGQHNHPEDIEYDKKRTEFLSSLGFKVLRFWNNDVDKNISGVYEILQKEFGVLEE